MLLAKISLVVQTVDLMLCVRMQVKELRAEVDRLLLRKIQAPDFDLSQSKAVDAMHQLLATDGF